MKAGIVTISSCVKFVISYPQELAVTTGINCWSWLIDVWNDTEAATVVVFNVVETVVSAEVVVSSEDVVFKDVVEVVEVVVFRSSAPTRLERRSNATKQTLYSALMR